MEKESVSNLIEMLCVEILKVSNLEHKKIEEHKKSERDYARIAGWDRASRAANERKAELKNRIDAKIKEVIEAGEYKYTEIVRDF